VKRSRDSGRPIGDDHHRTKISDQIVREMRDRYERERWTMERVRVEFSVVLGRDLSFHTVRAILRYTRRNVQQRFE
jgi:hypothetical protein